MRSNRSRDTGPELALRSELHRLGLRYRVNTRPVSELRVNADVVFGPARVAVFVDGCFWHRCPLHFTMPKSNRGWWEAKLMRNVERDRAADTELTLRGWHVMRVWEHEDPARAAREILRTVRRRQTSTTPTESER